MKPVATPAEPVWVLHKVKRGWDVYHKASNLRLARFWLKAEAKAVMAKLPFVGPEAPHADVSAAARVFKEIAEPDPDHYRMYRLRVVQHCPEHAVELINGRCPACDGDLLDGDDPDLYAALHHDVGDK